MTNCSCVAVVFNQGSCFLFNQISSSITIASVIGTLAFIGVLIYVGLGSSKMQQTTSLTRLVREDLDPCTWGSSRTQVALQ